MTGLAPTPLALPKSVQSSAVGSFQTVQKLDHGGSLQARRLSTGTVQFYWRYSHAGRTLREPIGVYDPLSPPKKREPTARGFSVVAACEQCRLLSVKHGDFRNVGGLPEAKALERRQYEAQKLAEAVQKATLEAKAKHSLESLLTDYIKHQIALGRVSAREAKNIFDLHVVAAWPAIAKTPASDVTQDQVIDMLRRLIEQGKGRTSNKLRTYLRAAYQCAIDVRVTASIPVAFKAYGVHSNPVAQTRRDSRFDRADKRPLSAEELRKYWKLIEKVPGLQGRCLRMHLLTAGQRIEQLVRLKWTDVRADSITILDGKGRPGQGARPHSVPIVPAAARDLQKFERVGDYVMSTSKGSKSISGTTLSGWAAGVVGDAIEDFQLKRVRSGVETLLAANRINREIRGHIQSHGLTGVQARHYDGHDYMQEKREAIDLLVRLLGVEAGPSSRKRSNSRSVRSSKG
jgi:integrase